MAMEMKRLPSSSRLWEELNYDPATGEFTWLRGKQGRRADLSAGYISHGYLRIHIDGQTHLAHRLAFVMMFGREPSGEVDHIDGNTRNNAINNLREATRLQNARNRRSVKGYSFSTARSQSSPYQARIKYDGRLHSIGSFRTEDAARAAYAEAANKAFGEFSPTRELGAADRSGTER